MKLKVSLILLAAGFVVYFFFSGPVLQQDQSYHHFVDTRTFFGIPNTLDVISNVFFLVVGFLGIKEVLRQSGLETRSSWFWFFVSILLVAPGSAYYHLAPNDFTLIWDRLPMSMGFMALYIVLLSEHVSLRIQKALTAALLLGLISVFTWVVTSDLRFYFVVQFSSFVTIPLILALFPSRYSLKGYYFVALAFYGLAKWAEVKDKEVFEATGHMISGHSLKHILAAVGLLALWVMLRKRQLSFLKHPEVGV